MADAAAAGEAPEAPAGGKKTGLIIGLTFAGAILGGVASALFIAPKMIARQAPPAAEAAHGPNADAAAEAAPAEGEGEGGGEGEGERQMVQLENIIVNPAGSNGNRFLMTTVAFSVVDEKAQKVLSDRKVELRDRVTTILETMSMADLTAPGARDSLKARIGVMVGTIVGAKVPVQVFLPQFVIQ